MVVKTDELLHEFAFSISCTSSFITNYKHIYIVNDINSPKEMFKQKNFQSGSCKLGLPNNPLEDELIESSYISIFYRYSKDSKHTQVFQRIP